MQYLIVLVVAVLIIGSLVKSFRDIRANARKKGYGPIASISLGAFYVALGILGVASVFYVIENFEPLGSWWALVWPLVILIPWIILGILLGKKPK